jgi:hypothetical protein
MSRPAGGALLGRAAILESYLSRPGGHVTPHICTNIRIAVESADFARGLSYALETDFIPADHSELRRCHEPRGGLKSGPTKGIPLCADSIAAELPVVYS